MPSFSEFYKLQSLVISDRISSLLKVNFDMTDMTCAEEPYLQFTKDLPKFSYISLYKYFSRGVLVLIDAKIIYLLSNKMLGGVGVIEKKTAPQFTESEDLFGTELTSWFTDYYEQNGILTSFLRVEYNVDHVHYFFPNEKVLTVKMKCKVNGKPIGYIAICHPKMFLEKQKELWTKS